MTVPKTDTGGLDEKSKAIGRRRFKELGKKAGRKISRCPGSNFRPYNKRLLVDCLPKTQVCAKAKAEVYGLRPAQRWKVKARRASAELKPRRVAAVTITVIL